MHFLILAVILCFCPISYSFSSSNESDCELPITEPTSHPENSSIVTCSLLPLLEPLKEHQEQFEICFVSEPQAAQLMGRMLALIGMWSTEGNYAESRLQKLKKIPESQEYEICSDQRIHGVTEELHWMSRQIWHLVVQPQNITIAQIQILKSRSTCLFRHLQSLRVFTGGSTVTCSMHLQTFDTQVQHLYAGYKTSLANLAAKQATAIPINSSISELRDPIEAISEAIPEALPQLISSWYAGKLENVQVILNFIQELPQVTHKILGYLSVFDEMKRNNHLESSELALLVAHIREINDSVTATSNDIPGVTLCKYKQLVKNVWPIYDLMGTNVKVYIRNVKYERDLTTYSFDRSDSCASLGVEKSGKSGWFISSILNKTQLYWSIRRLFASSGAKSSSRRSVKYTSEPFLQENALTKWVFVPVNCGKYFKILDAKFGEFMAADKKAKSPTNPQSRLVVLAGNQNGIDFEPHADLWAISRV